MSIALAERGNGEEREPQRGSNPNQQRADAFLFE
jgi:hypothetical protein